MFTVRFLLLHKNHFFQISITHIFIPTRDNIIEVMKDGKKGNETYGTYSH